MQYVNEIVTPVGKHKVIYRTMVTGAEREQIDGAQMRYVDTEDGKNFKVKDMQAVAVAQKHELLKVSLVSIDDDSTDCFPRLQKMYEPDYNAVYEAIEADQKKTATMT